jgi:mycothiol synthase
MELRDVAAEPTLASAALELLDRREADVGAPMVDESERQRLRSTADDLGPPTAGWHARLAFAGGAASGYCGGVIDGQRFTADLVVVPGPGAGPVTGALGGSLRGATPADVELQVWVRAASPQDEARLRTAGFAIGRRLEVLGRELQAEPGEEASPPPGVRIRAFDTEQDTDGVVRVLRDAYRGTEDGGWDRATFLMRTRLGWFRAEDLLVAEDQDGGISGLHWTKRRGDGVGEVHNLAVHPEAHGRGLGRALLWSGLRHLGEVGCGRVILWVDAANEAAVALYREAGFRRLWSDLAFRDRR